MSPSVKKLLFERPETPLLIVPGLNGSGADHWQTDWERRYPSARRVSQLNWEEPCLELWLMSLVDAVRRTPNAVLVGHSLGCILVAQLAARYPDLPIAGSFLVAPADVDNAERLPVDLTDFAPTPLRRLPFAATVVASTDDPYITIARAQMLADSWHARFINVGACGHINAAAGYGPWPAGERMLTEFVRSLPSGHHERRSSAAG